MKRRHKARRWVLQILYAWEIQSRSRSLSDEAQDFFSRRRIASGTRSFAEEILAALSKNMDEIDMMVDQAAENWDPARMSVIDRSILRLALVEFCYISDVPFKVTIDEAIQLADRYGGKDSARFVNGVLDAAGRRLDIIPS